MKKIYSILILVGMVSFMTSCAQETKDEIKDSKYILYYKNSSDTELVTEPYDASSTTADDLVQEFLDAMNEEPDSLSYKRAIPDPVVVNEISPVTNKEVTIDFSSSYTSMNNISEILCRTAIVKTLCQIGGVEFVTFTVEGQPLLDQNKKQLVSMKNDDFVVLENNANYSQDARFYLYFSSEKGDTLLTTRVRVTYDGTKSMEQMVIEYLIQGPTAISGLTKTLNATIPKGTKLIKASTSEDGTCTVDFNEKFLIRDTKIKDEVVIYSIVNTLKDLQGVKKVQFLINGEKKKTYGDIKNFDEEFDRNLDIMLDQ